MNLSYLFVAELANRSGMKRFVKITCFWLTIMLVLTVFVGCSANIGILEEEEVDQNTKYNLLLTEVTAEIVTDYEISGGMGEYDTTAGPPGNPSPIDFDKIVIPTVIHYRFTVKNVGKSEVKFDYDLTSFHVLPGDELSTLMPHWSNDGGWFPPSILPGEEAVFASNITIGTADKKGLEKIRISEFPDQETLDKIRSLAYTATLVIKDKQANEDIIRTELLNFDKTSAQ